MISDPPKVAVAANSLWYIKNFRAGLVAAMQARGLVPVLVAPDDGQFEGAFSIDAERRSVAIDRSGTNPLTEIRQIAAIFQALKSARCDALLSFTIKPNIYGGIAARLIGIPAIPTITGLGTVYIKGGWLKLLVQRMYRLAFRRCPVVFFENASDRDLFVASKIVERGRSRLVPGCGVDLERFAVGDLPQGAPVFLLIARILADKGVREFVGAARLLRAAGSAAKFQLLGPLDDANRTAISKSELDGWVREGVIEYLGETQDVRPFIARSSAVVLPSYREGLPRSLLEGAAMGRPLIATDVPGCREIVREGVNGFLCTAKDARTLADAMAKFESLPPADAASLAIASRSIAAQEFDERAVIDAYLAEIEAALSGDPREAA